MGGAGWVIEALREHSELALFLTLGLGYAVGKLRVGSIQLGSVIGVLLVGVAIGQLGIPVSEPLKSTFFLFRVHPGVLLGICAGGSTSAPALAAIQDVANSKIPTLGYGVSYAVGNVLLALWGSVIVVLMGA